MTAQDLVQYVPEQNDLFMMDIEQHWEKQYGALLYILNFGDNI